MNTVQSAKITLKDMDRELDNSKILEIMKDDYGIIEDLIEEVEGLESRVDERDDQIKSLQDAMDEMERNNE
jgi:hypothetical protein